MKVNYIEEEKKYNTAVIHYKYVEWNVLSRLNKIDNLLRSTQTFIEQIPT